jgi:hypothetical protein
MRRFEGFGRLDSANLPVDEVTSEVPIEQREKAVDELLELGMAVDGLLAQQIELDINALERATGRSFSDENEDDIRAHQRRAYRWTFLVSGLEHPNFVRIVAEVTDSGSDKIAAAAETLSA